MNVAGVLLAGGASRRFGSEKAVAAFGDGLLMEPPLHALVLACDGVAVSAGDTRAAAAIAVGCGYPVLADPAGLPGGPLAGVLAALRWARDMGAERLVVAPCDTPTLTADHLRLLIAAANPASAAAAASARGVEPLVSVWPVATGLAAVDAALASGDHPSVRSLLEQLDVQTVAGFDGVNVNTPCDLPPVAVLADHPPHARLFAFEDDFVRTLRCIPMCVRFKLDRTAVKLSLRQWSRFTLADRQALRRAPCATVVEIQGYRAMLATLIAARTDEPLKALADPPPGAWRDVTPPDAVRNMAVARGAGQLTGEAWRGLDDLQRYALIKLTRDKHENANFAPALREFGVTAPTRADRAVLRPAARPDAH